MSYLVDHSFSWCFTSKFFTFIKVELHAAHLHGRLGLLRCGFQAAPGLVHGYGLLVAFQYRPCGAVPGTLGYRETDLLVAVFCLTAWHGNKETVTASLHHLDAPDTEASVHRC